MLLIQIGYPLIYDKVRELTDGKDSTIPNEQAFYSADYGKITHRQILKICQNTFRGEPSRIEVSGGSGRIQTKSLTFDKEILEKVGKMFEAITSIEILDDKEKQKSDATEQRNLCTYKEMRDNEHSSNVGQQERSITGASNKYTNQDDESDKSQDSSIDYRNSATALQNGSSIADSTKDESGVYTSTQSNSVAQLQEQTQRQDFKKEEEANPYREGLLSSPDPYLAQTTEYLNNLREDFYEYQCRNCLYKEAVWKNNPKPKFCARCKTPSTEE